MLDYTKDYAYIKMDQFYIISKIISILYLITGLVYPIFAIITKLGNLYVNIAIISLFTIYSIVSIFLKEQKLKFAYKVIKVIMIGFIELVINVYALYFGTVNVNAIAIIISMLMIIFWILKVMTVIVGELVLNECNDFVLCAKEDIKPLAKVTDWVLEMFHKKPMFEFGDEPTPERLKEIAKNGSKSQKRVLSRMAFRDIDENIEKIYSALKVNDDGQVDLKDFIKLGLSVSNVLNSKTRSYHNIFASNYDRKTTKKIRKKGLLRNGFKEEDLFEYLDLIIKNNEKDISSLKVVLNDDNIKIENKNDAKKILKSFTNVLGAMQEIIYLFGYRKIKYDKGPNEKQMNALICALNICLYDDEESKQHLLNNAKINYRQKIVDSGGKIIKKLRYHKKDIVKIAPAVVEAINTNNYLTLLTKCVILLKD